MHSPKTAKPVQLVRIPELQPVIRECIFLRHPWVKFQLFRIIVIADMIDDRLHFLFGHCSPLLSIGCTYPVDITVPVLAVVPDQIVNDQAAAVGEQVFGGFEKFALGIGSLITEFTKKIAAVDRFIGAYPPPGFYLKCPFV